MQPKLKTPVNQLLTRYFLEKEVHLFCIITHFKFYLTEIIFLFQKQQEIQNHTIYNVLIKQLCQFDNEIKTHAWIEDNVLVKKVKEIEDALEDFVKTAKS